MHSQRHNRNRRSFSEHPSRARRARGARTLGDARTLRGVRARHQRLRPLWDRRPGSVARTRRGAAARRPRLRSVLRRFARDGKRRFRTRAHRARTERAAAVLTQTVVALAALARSSRRVGPYARARNASASTHRSPAMARRRDDRGDGQCRAARRGALARPCGAHHGGRSRVACATKRRRIAQPVQQSHPRCRRAAAARAVRCVGTESNAHPGVGPMHKAS